MRHLGYCRVSTVTQDSQLQPDALLGAGVQKLDIFSDVTQDSRTAIERPVMKLLLGRIKEGDTVVV